MPPGLPFRSSRARRRPALGHGGTRRLLPLTLAALLCGCAQNAPSTLRADPASAAPVDLSGHWELNYGQSDNVQEQLSGLVRELRRRAARAAQMQSERGGGGALGVSVGGSDSTPSVIGLARMAEMITSVQLLDIEQSRLAIRVKREGDFALSCDFRRGVDTVLDLGVGKEACGWDGSQLVFRISLPEGLAIRHRLSLAPSGTQLGLVTTVFSDRVSAPFTVTQVYDRYDPQSAGYRCEETLTRGRVCTTESR